MSGEQPVERLPIDGAGHEVDVGVVAPQRAVARARRVQRDRDAADQADHDAGLLRALDDRGRLAEQDGRILFDAALPGRDAQGAWHITRREWSLGSWRTPRRGRRPARRRGTRGAPRGRQRRRDGDAESSARTIGPRRRSVRAASGSEAGILEPDAARKPRPARTSARGWSRAARARRPAAAPGRGRARSVLALVDVERGERGRAAGRVAGVGRAVAKHGRAGVAGKNGAATCGATITPPSGR